MKAGTRNRLARVQRAVGRLEKAIGALKLEDHAALGRLDRRCMAATLRRSKKLMARLLKVVGPVARRKKAQPVEAPKAAHGLEEKSDDGT